MTRSIEWRRVALTTIALVLIHATPSNAQREMTAEGALFEKFKDSVFTLYTDAGKGSGFLVHSAGFIATNAHVLGASDHIRVLVNDTTKVAGIRIMQDDVSDIAIVRINPAFCSDLAVLEFPESYEDYAFVGERVVAIGSPLHQDRVLTSGIISKVDDDVVISDVNINAGSSGGPLLNLAGKVIGINTFGDVSLVGAGLNGSVSSQKLAALLGEAVVHAKSLDAPDATTYPIVPGDQFPAWALKRAALQEEWDSSPYTGASWGTRSGSTGRGKGGSVYKRPWTGNFNVWISTPPFFYHMSKRAEVKLARKRGELDDPATDSNLFGDLRSWTKQVGGWTPVVAVHVAPKVKTSVWTAKHQFKDDLEQVALLVNGEVRADLLRGMTDIPIRSGDDIDVARAGTFLFAPEIFAPDEAGVWPVIELKVTSAETPDEPVQFQVPPRTLQRIAADFEPYFWARQCRAKRLRVGSGVTETTRGGSR